MTSIIENSIISILIGLIIVFAYIAIYFRDKFLKTKDEYLDLADSKGFFTKKLSIMRIDERRIFNILVKYYNEQYYVFPQVRLSDILEVKNDLKDHDNLYREIDHRSIDFVIFDKDNVAPLIAVELNGKSHFQLNRRNRDQKIENLLTKIGVKFLTINVSDNKSESEIKQKIDELFKPSEQQN
jgi:hypothetical protein